MVDVRRIFWHIHRRIQAEPEAHLRSRGRLRRIDGKDVSKDVPVQRMLRANLAPHQPHSQPTNPTDPPTQPVEHGNQPSRQQGRTYQQSSTPNRLIGSSSRQQNF